MEGDRGTRPPALKDGKTKINILLVGCLPVPLPEMMRQDRMQGDVRIVIQNNMCYRFGIMGNNEKTISFCAVTENIDALDSLSASQNRSRSFLFNQAITNHIALHACHYVLVRRGMEE